MKRNTEQDFAGIEKIKEKQAWQLAQFEEWAARNDWQRFHETHYDWWMFPVDQPSSYGFTWVVYDYEVNELKKDPVYVKNYLRGVELLLRAWGWDLYNEQLIENPAVHQSWSNWPIRLYKCGSSLQLFGFTKEFESVKKYAQYLMEQGHSFAYNNRDLRTIFQD